MRKFQPESHPHCAKFSSGQVNEPARSLLKTLAQINYTLKNFSTAPPVVLLIVAACFLPDFANSQASAPRMESDFRPSTPPTPPPSATPALQAQPTAAPLSGRGVAPPQSTPARATPASTRPIVPNGGDTRPVVPPTPPPLATPASQAVPANQVSASASPRLKPSATPAKPPLTKPTPPAPAVVEPSKKFPKVVTKLMIDDLQKGRGRQAKPGAKLVVHFTSWLYDPTQPLGRGPQFETTVGKTPYKFTLQNPEALHIKGWEDGIADMKTGGRRRLIIPPELGYGSNGAGQVIPPGATLLYEIELIDVE